MTGAPGRVVICGAGIAGVSAAYHLAVERGVRDIVLVDDRAPLTLTSDKGTAAYRNWWPGPDDTMVRFMNRSIDWLERLAAASGDAFALTRRGYVFLTADRDTAAAMAADAAAVSALGAGPLRHHPGPAPYAPSAPQGFDPAATGADLVDDPAAIRRQFPFLAPDVVAMLHVRRAGWLDARRLGDWLLDAARARGTRLVRDRIVSVDTAGGRIRAVRLAAGGERAADTLVLAAGPQLGAAGALLGLDLPVVNELHGKMSLRDALGIIPREAPLMIWNDPVTLPGLGPLPAGVHFRPRGGADDPRLLVIWTWRDGDGAEGPDTLPAEPRFDPGDADILLRGLARMVPGLAAYFDRPCDAPVDGGYYCKTPENRPLIGPLPVAGAWVIGALSGYGVMASQAAAELLSAHLTGADLPDYAAAFHPARYDDPAFQAAVAGWDSRAGQL
ncbi:MAG: NAD(P)/FAD-dependent oxidoreductase [Gemmatimonadota bacterium]